MSLVKGLLLFLTSHIFSLTYGRNECTDTEYFTNEQLFEAIDTVVRGSPDLASTYDIGRSHNGIPLRVIRISAAPEDAMVPQVKLVGGIHGDEPPSTHVLFNFMKHLLRGYKDGEMYITWLLNNTRIHLLPRMNPDGFELAQEGICDLGTGRNNAHNVNLNRGFPQARTMKEGSGEPEVEAVISWSEENIFVLGAGLHTGSLVAVYPLDHPIDGPIRLMEKAPTTDDDVFVHLAKTYASNHLTMTRGFGCRGTHIFRDGIINGAEWYAAAGTMMDYSYFYTGTMELTLEVNCCKYPSPSQLCEIWHQNKLALTKFCAESVRGIRGTVTSSGIPLPLAAVSVGGRDMPVYTNSKGQFFRVLLPGRYYVKVEMIGMVPKSVWVVVKRPDTARFDWTVIDVDLQPDLPTDFPVLEETVANEGDPSGSESSGDDNSTSTWPQESITSLYDKGGLDPDVLPTNWSSDITDFSTIHDTNLLTRKSIFGKSCLLTPSTVLLIITTICVVFLNLI